MTLRKVLLNILLITGAMTALSSCNGQNKPQSSKKIGKTKILGNQVLALDQSIWAIYQDNKSNFWFGSKTNGVFRYDGQEIRHFTKEDGLGSNGIRGIQEDTLGNIFFETTSGINLFDGESFKSLNTKSNGPPSSTWRLEPNDLWFSGGYDKKGPYRYDGKRLYYLEFPKSPLEENFISKYPNVSHSPYGIYSIYKDRQGHIWFGTSDMGIYRFDGNTISYLYERQLTETPNGGAFGIRSIAEDKDGFFWICNANYKYRILQEDALSSNLVPMRYARQAGVKNKETETQYYLSIIADDNENLWMQSYDNGIWKNDGNKLTHYPVMDGNRVLKLLTLYKDNQGVLWLGTDGSGVYRFNGKSFVKFRP